MVKLPHWPVPYGTQNPEESPQRVLQLLRGMNYPQDNLPPVVHVAGTNGKGSTIAFMRYILQAAGYKVHAYTSPHIMRYNERICLAGKEIDDLTLHQAIEAARIAAGGMQVTFFEGTTAAAFYAFAQKPADVLLIETGMGGRLDATNVLSPALTIITPIHYDHTEYLGPTLAHIAFEKAGIMRPGVPCIIGPQSAEAMEVLLRMAASVGAPIFVHGRDWHYAEIADGFEFIDEEGAVEMPVPSLAGKHQIANASLAIAALQCLDLPITYGNIISGLTRTKWPARLQQIMPKGALPAGWFIWIDGAHNVHGAEALAQSIDSMVAGSKVVLINGRTKGRDIDGFLQAFVGKVNNVLAVRVNSEPKPEEPEVIEAVAKELGFADARSFESVIDAIHYCIEHEKAEKLTILVTGSLYLYADVMATNV